MNTQAQARQCSDCPNPAVVGLNGAWLCLVDFNRRLAEVNERAREWRALFESRDAERRC